jgi:hypothetical protein
MDDAARTWRVPPEPDFEALWAGIERDAFATSVPATRAWWRSPTWRTFSVGIAAALVAGVALGRLTNPGAPAQVTVALSPTASSDTSAAPSGVYGRAATELLGKTAVLLTALPSEAETGGSRFTLQALELLSTTRLLLDSPAASDARFKDLLEDLELILAQIAGLRTGRTPQEMELITNALEERDVVPRIRSAVARLASGDD